VSPVAEAAQQSGSSYRIDLHTYIYIHACLSYRGNRVILKEPNRVKTHACHLQPSLIVAAIRLGGALQVDNGPGRYIYDGNWTWECEWITLPSFWSEILLFRDDGRGCSESEDHHFYLFITGWLLLGRNESDRMDGVYAVAEQMFVCRWQLLVVLTLQDR